MCCQDYMLVNNLVLESLDSLVTQVNNSWADLLVYIEEKRSVMEKLGYNLDSMENILLS